ncbi:hypothetical protein OQA88_8027 [Cercophora sp. LCS_1]
MRLLILSLLPLVAAQSASTCVSPISVLYNAHPECARSCLGCTDSNESFAHACDINGACCQGYNALTFIPLVYGCVKTTCTEADAQASWEEFSRNCARRGFPVNEGDTPGGYEFVSYCELFFLFEVGFLADGVSCCGDDGDGESYDERWDGDDDWGSEGIGDK